MQTLYTKSKCCLNGFVGFYDSEKRSINSNSAATSGWQSAIETVMDAICYTFYRQQSLLAWKGFIARHHGDQGGAEPTKTAE